MIVVSKSQLNTKKTNKLPQKCVLDEFYHSYYTTTFLCNTGILWLWSIKRASSYIINMD